jgi:hypothetical protein
MLEMLLAFLGNSVWQTSVIGGIGWLLARALRPARLRFQFLAVTLAVAAGTPLLSLLPQPARPAVTAIAAPQVELRGAQIAGAIYLAGLILGALRFVHRAARAKKIAASSRRFADGLRVSPLIDSPITIGRTIFLPPSLLDDVPLFSAALAHERAHVRRNDYALHVALECLALPLYFHPLIVLLRRALAEAREIACDEEAAAQCGADAYAGALVRIATLAASQRDAMSVSMAGTSIERRIAALLRGDSHRVSRPMTIALVLPFVAAIACSRFDVAPAIEQVTLCGRWSLVRESSDLHEVLAPDYDEFTQTIEHGPTRVAVRQRRVADGRALDVAWTVVTDGVRRPISPNANASGTATWRNGRLTLDLAGPGTQREKATAYIRNGRLVCDGVTNQGRYHAEFQRVDP